MSSHFATTDERFVVQQIGTRAFVAHDNVSQLDYDVSFTLAGARRAVDQRNVTAHPNAPIPGGDQ